MVIFTAALIDCLCKKALFVQGQHKPLITEELFYRVQDVLDGRARVYRLKIVTKKEFPLRGFFVCPKCHKKLTASKCKGRHKYYYYYHCDLSCKYRMNSESANELFIQNLRRYKPVPEIKKLYSAIIAETYREKASSGNENKTKLLAQINEYEKRLSNARDLHSTFQIEADDYKIMKYDYSTIIEKLESQLSELSNSSEDVEGHLNQRIERLIGLNFAYENASLGEARELIGLTPKI